MGARAKDAWNGKPSIFRRKSVKLWKCEFRVSIAYPESNEKCYCKTAGTVIFYLFLILLLLNILLSNPASVVAKSNLALGLETVWGRKPVLQYLLFNSTILKELEEELNLTETQVQGIENVVRMEAESLHLLYLESENVVRNESLSLKERRKKIDDIKYNERVIETVEESRRRIEEILSSPKYTQFEKWIEEKWILEKKISILNMEKFQTGGNFVSYEVYTTQYYGETNYEVALPDKYLKFANRDWYHYPGYERNDYSVQIARGNSTVSSVLIWDVGPWNEDDNYWNPSPPTGHPRPRRMFTDLPQGMPEAQAAYFNDYNGGKDQFGRLVTNPAGIDIAPAVAGDLGLGYLENDWVTVTYLWEEIPEEQLTLAVTDPYYDDIGSILSSMGYDFVEIQHSQLGEYDFIKDFDAIFINCSPDCDDNAPAAETSLRQYVENGGAIYASDWAFIYLETSFPEYIDFPADPYIGAGDQHVTATVTDPGLAQYLGTDTVDLYYNLSAWVVMSDVGPDTDVLLQGSYETYSSSKPFLEKGKRSRTLKSSLTVSKANTMTDKPLAVFFRYGDGSVTYTTFHNEAQTTELQQKLLEYLVLKPVTSEIARDLINHIIQWGGTVVGETIDTTNQGETSTFTYVSSELQDLIFGLGWSGSTMKLSIYRPGGSLYVDRQSNTSPIFIEVPNAEAGEWTYKVTAMDVAYDNYPFVVEIGSKAPSGSLAITVYPNPCYLNTGQSIKIVNLPLNSKVYIYTISGGLVRTLDNASEIITGGSSTTAFWDCKNDLGEEVARGIYIYLATDDAGSKKTGKIAIIK